MGSERVAPVEDNYDALKIERVVYGYGIRGAGGKNLEAGKFYVSSKMSGSH